jgi:hypothetical protein
MQRQIKYKLGNGAWNHVAIDEMIDVLEEHNTSFSNNLLKAVKYFKTADVPGLEIPDMGLKIEWDGYVE